MHTFSWISHHSWWKFNLIIWWITMCTVDIMTAKFLWKSLLSTKDGKYACMDIRNFFIDMPLDQYEYTCVSFNINIFPKHTIQQYNLHEHERHECIYTKSERPSMNCHMLESLPTSYWRNVLHQTVIIRLHEHQVFGSMFPTQLFLCLLWMILESNMFTKWPQTINKVFVTTLKTCYWLVWHSVLEHETLMELH